MGYSHYWRIEEDITPSNFKRIQTKAVEFAAFSDVPVEININTLPANMSLEINGFNEDANETFFLTPGSVSFDCCKTGQKPYDEIVVAVLNYAGHGLLTWWSDGSGFDLISGRVLYQLAGAGLPPSLTRSERPKDLKTVTKMEVVND